MTEKRKLIEVALPLEAINRESAREKSIRHGHPSTLHLWWARRPLAACRALLFASYVDDPSAHPERFPTEEAQQVERERLFAIIEELVRWENSTHSDVLSAAQAEIAASCDGMPPPVCDPFCGGGSIPLEAQRLGLSVYASDLNPVAVLVTKALVEIPVEFTDQPPIHPNDGSKLLGSWPGAGGLAEDVRYYGRWLRDQAEQRIGHLYPRAKLPAELGGGDATVIAWIWARTVKSPNPAWDGPMPLVRSFALSTKKGKETWVEPIVDRDLHRIRFEIRSGRGCPEGTVGRNGAVCLATGTPVPLSYVRDEGKAGRMGVQLMAIVAEGSRGRIYLPPDDYQENVATSAQATDVLLTELPDNPRWFSPPGFGMTRHCDLFTQRELMALCTFTDLVTEARTLMLEDGADEGRANSVSTYLGLLVSRLADYVSTISRWSSSPKNELVINAFSRQAVPMTWDFAEANPFATSSGSIELMVRAIGRVLDQLVPGPAPRVTQRDAVAASPEQSVVFVTDPPYYDNIGYADLSDFFYVWLRRSLKAIYPELFSTLLTPKAQELIADPYRHERDREAAERHFEAGIGAAFVRMKEAQSPDFPLTVIYAFKQAEQTEGPGGLASTGWETMLEGLVAAGLSVRGTWPLRSERGGRMISVGTNALASSIALVCRARASDAPMATRKELVAALRAELPGAVRHLQQGSIAPVDLAQAAIGPGMAAFSRYSRVIEADGSAMSVRTALGLINEVLDETLAEQEADFDADTRWAVSWFEEYGVNAGPFGVAETLSKAKNTAVNGLVAAGILESKAGKVRLLDRSELTATWDPGTDARLTVWEISQHLIRALESGGETEAAVLLRRIGGLGETARELAYRLYVICERKKWAREALSYNTLVVAWPEISRLASSGPAPTGPTQQGMF